MKSAFLFFFGLIAILSAFYLINPTELQLSSFNQVFAQSEGKNKNFGDAITIHSSETNTNEKTRINNIQEKNFDDTKIIPSSDTATKEKSQDKNGENRNFDEATISQSSDTSTIANQNNKTSFIGRLAPGEFTKIHPAITQILEHANPKGMAKIYGASIENDTLYVYVHLADKKIQNKLLDIEILAQDKNIIVSKLSLSKIRSLATLDYVERITLPDHAVFYDDFESEGVSFSMADDMHAAGFKGTGIKVAVIDDSFFITHHKIVDNIEFSHLFDSENKCFGNINCNKSADNSHGTAVAEIVVDMAPDVNLLLYTIKNSVDFANAIDNATSKGADIITASLGFPSLGGDGSDVNDWYRDGTSSAAKKVNEATDNEILFTVAAGNEGSSHWMGNYTANSTRLGPNLETDLFDSINGVICSVIPDPETGCPPGQFVVYQSVMMFNSGLPNSSLQACLPVTADEIGAVFRATWNAWDTTTEDYDLIIYDSTASIFKTVSAIIQAGGGAKPYEETLPTSATGDLCIIIASFGSSEDHLFHISIDDATLDAEYVVPSISIDTPADASGALTVGAINFDNTASICPVYF